MGGPLARIFSVSYDSTLLRTRELLLNNLGHSVTSAEGIAQAFELYNQNAGTFDLMVLGHSIPPQDKRAIIRHCDRASRHCPVLSLTLINEPPVPEAAHSVDPTDTRMFLSAVQELLRNRAAHTQQA